MNLTILLAATLGALLAALELPNWFLVVLVLVELAILLRL